MKSILNSLFLVLMFSLSGCASFFAPRSYNISFSYESKKDINTFSANDSIFVNDSISINIDEKINLRKKGTLTRHNIADSLFMQSDLNSQTQLD